MVAVPNLLRGADDPKDARKELEKLQGTWQLVSAETDGKKAPQEQLKKVRVVIRGQKHTVFFGDKAVAKEIAFRIDPTKNPKTVDDLRPTGQSILGIYELKGDTLRSCVAPAGKERPTRFAAEAGSGHTLRVFRRVGDGKAPK
jgi:uncharacterized protein (TIGR03067 family)